MLNQNWKGLLILLVPLLYQTIRKFLDEIQEGFGMKRQPKNESAIVTGEKR